MRSPYSAYISITGAAVTAATGVSDSAPDVQLVLEPLPGVVHYSQVYRLHQKSADSKRVLTYDSSSSGWRVKPRADAQPSSATTKFADDQRFIIDVQSDPDVVLLRTAKVTTSSSVVQSRFLGASGSSAYVQYAPDNSSRLRLVPIPSSNSPGAKPSGAYRIESYNNSSYSLRAQSSSSETLDFGYHPSGSTHHMGNSSMESYAWYLVPETQENALQLHNAMVANSTIAQRLTPQDSGPLGAGFHSAAVVVDALKERSTQPSVQAVVYVDGQARLTVKSQDLAGKVDLVRALLLHSAPPATASSVSAPAPAATTSSNPMAVAGSAPSGSAVASTGAPRSVTVTVGAGLNGSVRDVAHWPVALDDAQISTLHDASLQYLLTVAQAVEANASSAGRITTYALDNPAKPLPGSLRVLPNDKSPTAVLAKASAAPATLFQAERCWALPPDAHLQVSSAKHESGNRFTIAMDFALAALPPASTPSGCGVPLIQIGQTALATTLFVGSDGSLQSTVTKIENPGSMKLSPVCETAALSFLLG